MSNTATPKAQELADANGIDIQALDGGEDNRVTLAEVKAAIKKQNAEPAEAPKKKKKAAASGLVIYLGMSNSSENVRYKLEQFAHRYPDENNVLVQSRRGIQAPEGFKVEVSDAGSFVRRHLKDIESDNVRIAYNGTIREDKEAVIAQLKGAYRTD
jgi:pyruvate/2-oxoglutarate dehydrogenase complex dihydrolipoamide acyltransferase (E2) component